MKYIVYLLYILLQSNLLLAQSPGLLDYTFGSDGKVLHDLGLDVNTGLAGVAVQHDGKTVAVGRTTDSTGGILYAVRLLKNGSIDYAFGSNGVVHTDLLGNASGFDVLIGKNGYIYITGLTSNLSREEMFIIRLLPNGEYDSTFSADGIFNANLWEQWGDNNVNIGYKIIELPDGSLLVGGGFDEFAAPMDIAAFKVTPDGQFDTTFGGGDGYVHYYYTSFIAYILRDIAVQTDGKILLTGGGGVPPNVFVYRLHADGSLDSSFAGNGLKLMDFYGDTESGVAIRQTKDGKILLAGYRENPQNNPDIFMVRLLSNGQIDSTFGVNGFSVYDDGNFQGTSEMIVLPNTDIILAGFCSLGNGNMFVVCYDSSGTLQPKFNDGKGYLNIDISGYENSSFDAAMQPNGKVVLMGYAYDIVTGTNYTAFARLHSTYSLASFGNKTVAKAKQTFTIFPNPADRQVTLLYKAKDGAQQATVKIRDITGRLINTFTIQANSPYVYATDRLPGAVYFITLYDGGKPAQTHKLVLLK